MSELKLIPAKQNRTSDVWSDDDYDVVLVETGEWIGLIFRLSPGMPGAWFWGIDDVHAGRRNPHYGYAESKEEAKLAFSKCWRGI